MFSCPYWVQCRFAQGKDWFNFPGLRLCPPVVTSDWFGLTGRDDAKSIEFLFLRNLRILLTLRWIVMDMLSSVCKDILVLSIEETEVWRAKLLGSPVWEYSYPVEYRDRYGYSAGPRASPVIRGGLVYIHGVTAWLTCLELETGKLVWKRDLTKDYQIPRYFFGKGSNPIIFGNVLVLNLGGGKGQCMAGFNRMTGETI